MIPSSTYDDSVAALQSYGSVIYFYSGTGELGTTDGAAHQCRFTAGQLQSGRIVILASCGPEAFSVCFGRCNSFSGTTREGHRLVGTLGLHEINHLPDLPQDRRPGVWTALEVQRMEVEFPSATEASHATYMLTNVALPPRALRPPLPGLEANLVRIDNYSRVMRRLQVLKDVQVTGELHCRLGPHGSEPDPEHHLSALCHVLSVANGSPVEWIVATHMNEEDRPIRRIHHAGIAKDYGAHRLLSHSEVSDYQLFLDVALPAYEKNRSLYRLDSGTIAAYLDAKAEHDYLEHRGVKAVVAMEMLRTTILGIPNTGISATIVDGDTFQGLTPLITSALHDRLGCRVSSNDRSAMLAHLPGMNRRSFGHHLRKIIRHLGADVSEGEQRLFVACRNKLVHECAFYTQAADADDRAKVAPLDSPYQEYCFLIHVLDKLIIALLQYPGRYYDWTASNGPELRPSGWRVK